MTITVLTAEQRAAIPEHVQRWIDIGLSTEPVDRKRATEAVRACYVLAGLEAPRIEFVQSFETQKPVDVWLDVWTTIREAVWKEIEATILDGVLDTVHSAVWREVGAAVREAKWSWAAVWGGQYDVDTCVAWRYCVDVLGVRLPADIRARLDAWCEVVQSCGGVYWGRDVATIVDRPAAFERNTAGRITAVVYRDDWRVQV